uniref:RNase H type-1 domain-containing protein n=1 Tax=Leersia perrieri TaxID=77586 RepID=A0A0D9XQD7_9ORYZ
MAPASWRPPLENMIKINCDGAFNANDMSAASRWLASVSSALVAEVEAYRDGLQMIQTVGARDVILETDLAQLVSL